MLSLAVHFMTSIQTTKCSQNTTSTNVMTSLSLLCSTKLHCMKSSLQCILDIKTTSCIINGLFRNYSDIELAH